MLLRYKKVPCWQPYLEQNKALTKLTDSYSFSNYLEMLDPNLLKDIENMHSLTIPSISSLVYDSAETPIKSMICSQELNNIY